MVHPWMGTGAQTAVCFPRFHSYYGEMSVRSCILPPIYAVQQESINLVGVRRLSSFAVHRLADDRWEVLSPDDDPMRPSWRRVAVIDRRRPPVRHAPARGGRRG